MNESSHHRIWLSGGCFAATLFIIVIALLAFAHAYAEMKPEAPKCFVSFVSAQWPRWIGCAMAAHENLSGGLIAAAGALLAAWLAYAGVQQQIAREGVERNRSQAETKLMATLALTQPIHAAALTLLAVKRAVVAESDEQREADKLVDYGVVQLRAALNHYTLRELAKDLSVDDRAVFLVILMTLTTFTNLRENQSPALDRLQRLLADQNLLSKLHVHLENFDSDLADVFARDSASLPKRELAESGD